LHDTVHERKLTAFLREPDERQPATRRRDVSPDPRGPLGGGAPRRRRGRGARGWHHQAAPPALRTALVQASHVLLARWRMATMIIGGLP